MPFSYWYRFETASNFGRWETENLTLIKGTEAATQLACNLYSYSKETDFETTFKYYPSSHLENVPVL